MRASYETDDTYFAWLRSKIHSKTRPKAVSTHNLLLHALHQTTYGWIFPMDENRLGEAKRMRSYYKNEVGTPAPNEAYSLLEVMIGLADRMEHEYLTDAESYGDRTGVWFWNMVSSMNLMDYDDEHFIASEVEEKIGCMLGRGYASDGFGSLFFIPGVKRDMRKLQIWDQMLCYVSYVLSKTD